MADASGEKVDNKVRLEVLRQQEELIKEEAAEKDREVRHPPCLVEYWHHTHAHTHCRRWSMKLHWLQRLHGKLRRNLLTMPPLLHPLKRGHIGRGVT